MKADEISAVFKRLDNTSKVNQPPISTLYFYVRYFAYMEKKFSKYLVIAFVRTITHKTPS